MNVHKGLAAALAVALAATACTTDSSDESSDSSSRSNGTIRSALVAPPSGFAPWDNRGVNDSTMAKLLYSTLVARDGGNRVVGALASEWDVTPTKGVFTIRTDSTCADGTEITPTVVADSLKKFATAEESTQKGSVFGPGTPTITADDQAGTVSIELAQPWSDLLPGLSLEATSIVCPAGLDDVEKLRTGDVEGAFSGPYALSKSVPGTSYTLTLRDDFVAWPEFADPAPQGEPAKTVEMTVVPNFASRASQLLTGGMDIADILTADMTRFDEKDDFLAQRINYAAEFLIFNERENSVTSDPAVRMAIAQAVSREAFNQAANGGRSELANTFVMPGVECALADDSALIAEDADAAKATLDGTTVRLSGMNAIGPQGAGVTYIGEALRAAGADVDVDIVDGATSVTKLFQEPDTWDVTVVPLTNAGGLMNGAVSFFVGATPEEGGRNATGDPKPELASMVEKAMAASDPSERCDLFEQVQRSLIGNADVVPLAYMPNQVTARPGFWVGTYNDSADASTMRTTSD